MAIHLAPTSQTLTVSHDGVAVCEVRGELDSSSMNAFRQGAGALPCFPAAVLDLSQVGFVDSAGLGAIIGVLRKARDRGCPVVIVSTDTYTTKLFRTVGIDRMAPIVSGLADAVALVRHLAADRHEAATDSSEHRRIAL